MIAEPATERATSLVNAVSYAAPPNIAYAYLLLHESLRSVNLNSGSSVGFFATLATKRKKGSCAMDSSDTRSPKLYFLRRSPVSTALVPSYPLGAPGAALSVKVPMLLPPEYNISAICLYSLFKNG